MLRIFVSHSTARDPAVARLCGALVTALRAEKHQVLFDRDTLRPGTSWRSTLNVWMSGCDVAIVVLSRDALTSPYVAYEASILGFRKARNPSFGLLPVLVEPVTLKAVEGSALDPTTIDEIHPLFTAQNNAAGLIDQVLAQLSELEPNNTPLDRAAQSLRELLQRAQISDERMRERLEELDVDVPPWVPGEDLRGRLALSMLAAGLEGNARFIRQIQPLPGGDGQELIDLLGCSWVDYRAIRGIPEAAQQGRVIATNASHDVTAKMYVKRSSIEESLKPSGSWRFAAVDANVAPPDDPAGEGESPELDELVAQVRDALRQPFGTRDQAKLDDYLKVLRKEEEPVFVALPADRVTAELLAGLGRIFAGVSFFLLTGTHGLPQPLLPNAEWLEPELDPEAEAAFADLYRRKSRVLQIPNIGA